MGTAHQLRDSTGDSVGVGVRDADGVTVELDDCDGTGWNEGDALCVPITRLGLLMADGDALTEGCVLTEMVAVGVSVGVRVKLAGDGDTLDVSLMVGVLLIGRDQDFDTEAVAVTDTDAGADSLLSEDGVAVCEP